METVVGPQVRITVPYTGYNYVTGQKIRSHTYVIQDGDEKRTHKIIKLDEQLHKESILLEIKCATNKNISLPDLHVTKRDVPYYLFEARHNKQDFNLALCIGWITNSLQSTRAVRGLVKFIKIVGIDSLILPTNTNEFYWPQHSAELICYNDTQLFLCTLTYDYDWYYKEESYKETGASMADDFINDCGDR